MMGRHQLRHNQLYQFIITYATKLAFVNNNKVLANINLCLKYMIFVCNVMRDWCILQRYEAYNQHGAVE